MFAHTTSTIQAPEFPATLEWLNSDPVSLKSLRGHVVVLNFGTLSCADSIRSARCMSDWSHKYSKHGLQVVGVHSPEFSYEKIKKNVGRELDTLGIEYPVVLDSDFTIWDLYKNHWRPRTIVVNKNGQIIYDHIGIAQVDAERIIHSALLSHGARSLPAVTEYDHEYAQTVSENYFGYGCGSIANRNIEKDHFHKYKKSRYRTMPSLEGTWKVTREYAESGGGALHIPVTAREVNLVAGSGDDAEVDARFTIDGNSIKTIDAGNDVTFDDEGSMIKVGRHKMHNIMLSDDVTGSTMQMDVPSGVKIYSTIFGE